MTRKEAIEMAGALQATGEFSAVKVSNNGPVDGLTMKFTDQKAFVVDLWSVNAAAGNRNLSTVTQHAPDMVDALARQALGKANARDRKAFRLMEAQRELDSE